MSFLQNIFGGRKRRAQEKKVQQVLEAGSDVSVDALQGMSHEEQKVVLVAALEKIEQMDKTDMNENERRKLRNTARQLNHRLELIEKLKRARQAAKSLPDGGLKYVCHTNNPIETEDVDYKFDLTCQPFAMSDIGSLDELQAVDAGIGEDPVPPQTSERYHDYYHNRPYY